MLKTLFSWMFIFLVVFCFAPQAALADSTELAQSHYMAGQAYYKQARYQQAIQEFEEAYRLSNKPALLFNIAQAYERMGDLEKSVDYLKQYLKHPDTKEQSSVEEQLRNLEERIKKTSILIECDIPGGSVKIDGQVVGVTPLASPVPSRPGSHEIKVEKTGYKVFSAYVSVPTGSVVPVKVTLESEQGTGTLSGTGQGTTSGGSTDTPTGTETGGGRKRLWTWVAAGTAGGLLIVGGVTGGLALGKAGEANDAAGTSNHEDLKSSAKSLALVSDVTIGLGALCAVGAAILYFYEGKSAEKSQVRITPLFGPQHAGLGTTITF